MVNILEEKGLFLVWSENFFLLTWKLEEKDCACDSTIRSSEFHFRGKEEDSYFEVHITEIFYLYLHNPLKLNEGHFEISITDAEHQIIHSSIESASFECSDKIDLLKSFHKHFPTVNPTYPILITCVWKNSNESLSKMANETVDNSALLSDLMELSSDLKKALDGNLHADVLLKIGEESIKTNKMILRARSPVFAKMFCHESLENISNEVVISDIQAKTVERLVNYLYTATVEKCDFEDALELYCAADKYEVLSLRDNCREDLLKLLQVGNAGSLFSVAHRHCDEELKERVVQYVSDDFDSVADSDSFAELSRDEMKELTRSVLKVQRCKKQRK